MLNNKHGPLIITVVIIINCAALQNEKRRAFSYNFMVDKKKMRVSTSIWVVLSLMNDDC